jgi:hypothetical protein
MRGLFTVIFWMIALLSFSQWQDDFSDGDFTNGKVWFGDIDSFVVENEQLRLMAPANASRSYLATESDASVDGMWEFYVEMGFNPSSTNRAFVYLISDNSNLKEPLNGYFVMLGNTADEVSLYRQNGNSWVKIIDGEDGILNTNRVRVRVRVNRDALGNWELFADTSVGFTGYVSQGTVFDNTYMNGNYFGVLCQYTATRSNQFWFDDFNVTATKYVDVTPPVLLSHTVNPLNRITLQFNENLNASSAVYTNHYSVVPDLQTPFQAEYFPALNQVRLEFYEPVKGGVEYNFRINGVTDLAGNALDTSFVIRVRDAYGWNSVLINEIYPDENPSFGLPVAEFVELYNPGEDTLFTQGWRFANDNSFGNFPADTILPGQFVIICRSSAVAEYSAFGKTMAITSMPALKNAGDELRVLDRYGNVLDSLHYFNSWFRNILDDMGNNKKDGGYTLERISTNSPCRGITNWYPSVAEIGGTPAAPNSVSDIDFQHNIPVLTSAFATEPTRITLVFSESVNPLLAINTQLYSVSGGVSVSGALVSGGNLNTIVLQVSPPLESSQSYTLSVWGIEDCFGNVSELQETEVFLALSPVAGDIVINEILFNPVVGGADYLEIYNRSGKALNIQGLRIVRYRLDNPEEIMQQVLVASQPMVMPPYSYFTYTSDTANVLANYHVENPEWLFQLNLPNFPNSEAILAITLFDTMELDRLQYRTNWHFELLDNQRGVSLERINPDGSTQDRHNWKSAAGGRGSGTPTYRNSQFFQSEFTSSTLWVEPEVFTPDGDGYKDFTQIFYKVSETGYVANVAVFDAVGREVRRLASNQLIPTEGQWRWDGANMLGEKAPIGIYIVLVELFSPSGKKEMLKEKVVLGARF